MEVLCTYRLLFGQHPRARYLYRRADSTKSALSITGTDPLLRELCGSSHNKSRLFDCINAFPAKIVHSARSDFPYLGRRLVKLHQYVINQNPSDLTALWYDRRDLNRFYTFWAVVLVGGISLFLSFVQVLLSAVQVWEGRKL
jgi:hypothetical protein